MLSTRGRADSRCDDGGDVGLEHAQSGSSLLRQAVRQEWGGQLGDTADKWHSETRGE